MFVLHTSCLHSCEPTVPQWVPAASWILAFPHYISTLSFYPPRTVIVDLGCGDAVLACALILNTVMSFDLVADHTFVVEADIFDCLGFDSDGGEESSQGYVQIANVVYVWHVHTQIYLILCWWRNATLGPASPG